MAQLPLTYATALVIQAIAGGYRYGFDVIDATGLASGTVYPALRRLERLRMIRGAWESDAVAREAGRPSRRYYELTAKGEGLLETARLRYPGVAAALRGLPAGARG